MPHANMRWPNKAGLPVVEIPLPGNAASPASYFHLLEGCSERNRLLERLKAIEELDLMLPVPPAWHGG